MRCPPWAFINMYECGLAENGRAGALTCRAINTYLLFFQPFLLSTRLSWRAIVYCTVLIRQKMHANVRISPAPEETVMPMNNGRRCNATETDILKLEKGKERRKGVLVVFYRYILKVLLPSYDDRSGCLEINPFQSQK